MDDNLEHEPADSDRTADMIPEPDAETTDTDPVKVKMELQSGLNTPDHLSDQQPVSDTDTHQSPHATYENSSLNFNNHHDVYTDSKQIVRLAVEDKSQLLSNTWNELYNLLGDYKAQLFSKEAAQQYNMNHSDLQHELLLKENENAQLRMEMDSFRQRDQQWSMDISVKDSLLQKYQEDLLEKEQKILSSSNKISRLEQRLRLVEGKNTTSPPPGKTQQQRSQFTQHKQFSRMRSPARSPALQRAVQSGHVMKSPAAIKALIPGRAGLTGRGGRLPGGPARRRNSLSATGMPPVTMATSDTQPSTSQAPIVCIEVDDDDVIHDVTAQSELVKTETMDAMSWGEEDVMKIEPALDNTVAVSDQDVNEVNEALMHQDSLTYMGDSMENVWPVHMSPADLVATRSPRGQKNNMTSPGNKEEDIPEGLLREVSLFRGELFRPQDFNRYGNRRARTFKAHSVRSAMILLESLGGGSYIDGVFRKSHPNLVPQVALDMCAVTFEEYKLAYDKGTNPSVLLSLASWNFTRS